MLSFDQFAAAQKGSSKTQAPASSGGITSFEAFSAAKNGKKPAPSPAKTPETPTTTPSEVKQIKDLANVVNTNLNPEKRPSVIESVKQGASGVADALKKGAGSIKDLAGQVKDYVTRPEKTSAALDVAVGADLAERAVKTGVETTFNVGKSLVKGFTSMITAGTQDVPLVKDMTRNATDFINATIEGVGDDVSKAYEQFSKKDAKFADNVIQVAKTGTNTAMAATTDVIGAIPETLKDTPGVQIPALAFLKLGRVLTNTLTKGAQMALDHVPYMSEQQKTDVAQTLGNIGTMFVMAKGAKKGGEIYGRFTENFGKKVGDAKAANSKAGVGDTVSDVDVAQATHEAAKETPAEIPYTRKVGDVELGTDQRLVLETYIKGNDALNYKIIDKFGDPNIQAKFDFDFETKKGTIYATEATTAGNLAHELGHHFDQAITEKIGKSLSDVLELKYAEHQADVDGALASYAIKRRGGEATIAEISGDVQKLVESMKKDIDTLSGNVRGNTRENFADAVREVILNYDKAKASAPEFTDFIADQLRSKGLVAEEVTRAAGDMADLKENVPPLEGERVAPKQERVSAFTKGKGEAVALTEQNSGPKGGPKGVKPSELVKFNQGSKETVYLAVPESVKPVLEAYAALNRGMRGKAGEFDRYRNAVRQLMASEKVTEAVAKQQINEVGAYYRQIAKDVASTDSTMFLDTRVKDVPATVLKPAREGSAQPADVQTPVEASTPAEPKASPKPRAQKQGVSARTGLDTGARVKNRPAFRPDKINAPKDVVDYIQGEAAKKDQYSEFRISKSKEQIKDLSQSVGITADDLVRMEPGSIVNAETALRAREIVNQGAQEILDLTKKVKESPNDKTLIKELAVKTMRQQAISQVVAGFGTEGSNLLRSFQVKSGAGLNDVAVIEQIMKEANMSEAAATELHTRITRGYEALGKDPTPDKVSKMIGEVTASTKVDGFFDYFYSNILSGYKTAGNNFVDNALNLATELGVKLTQDPKNMGKYLRAVVEGFGDGWDKAKLEYKFGDVIRSLEAGKLPVDRKFENPILNNTVGLSWRVASKFSRALMAADAITREPARRIIQYSKAVEIAKNQYKLHGLGKDASLEMQDVYRVMEKGYEKTGYTLTPAEIKDALDLQGGVKAERQVEATLKELEDAGAISRPEQSSAEMTEFADKLYQDGDLGRESTIPNAEVAKAKADVRLLETRYESTRALAAEGDAAAQAILPSLEAKLTDAQVNLSVALRASDIDFFGARGVFAQTEPAGLPGAITKGLLAATNDAAILKAVTPFARIVGNRLNGAIDYTPWGFVRAYLNQSEGSAASKFIGKNPTINPLRGEVTAEGRAAEVRRAALGTAAMVTLLYLDQSGAIQITGSGPSDLNRRKELKATGGWQPNSIILGDGKTKLSIANWGAMGLVMSAIGNYADSIRYNGTDPEDAAQRMGAFVSAFGKAVVSQSFLKNVGDTIDSIQNWDKGGANVFKSLVANNVSSLIAPNIFRQIAKVFDPTQYDTPTIWDAIKNNLGITGGLKPSLNVYGEPVQNNTNMQQLLTNSFPNLEDPNPVRRHLSQNDVHITVPSKATKIATKSGKREMTPDEYRSYVEISGKAISQALEKNSKYIFGIKDQEALKKYVSGIVDNERSKALTIVSKKAYTSSPAPAAPTKKTKTPIKR